MEFYCLEHAGELDELESRCTQVESCRLNFITELLLMNVVRNANCKIDQSKLKNAER
jgi:hypothetical protein